MSARVIPLKLGTAFGRSKAKMLGLRQAEQLIDLAFVGVLIESGAQWILLDTGPGDPADSFPGHKSYEVKESERLPDALASVGLTPDDISTVILSHLHWDHCYNNHLFPKARFLVQRSEMQYAIAPLPFHEPQYEALSIGGSPPWLRTPNLEWIRGDVQLTSDVTLLHTPGHTPGSMVAVVETAEGCVVVASDTVPLYENLTSDPSERPDLPYMLYVDLEEYTRSLQRVRGIADVIIPGHDPKLFDEQSG